MSPEVLYVLQKYQEEGGVIDQVLTPVILPSSRFGIFWVVRFALNTFVVLYDTVYTRFRFEDVGLRSRSLDKYLYVWQLILIFSFG